MLKKIRKAIKKDLGKFYEEFEDRFLRSEKKMYKKMEDRLNSLEDKFEKLSMALLGHLDKSAEVKTPKTENMAAKEVEKQAPEVAQPEEEKVVDVNDLKTLKGLGKSIEKKLKAEGISNLNQIAEMTEDAVKALNEKIAGFEVRFNRYDWKTQAQNFLGTQA